mmetsp:Transcript_91983/g.192331  ORF Transcript_91983/g.192331 Transcript_91983/m.192331 type:complete len:92 (-) Transcript_91983:844-1119(-)
MTPEERYWMDGVHNIAVEALAQSRARHELEGKIDTKHTPRAKEQRSKGAELSCQGVASHILRGALVEHTGVPGRTFASVPESRAVALEGVP